jgi:hypothetical protein
MRLKYCIDACLYCGDELVVGMVVLVSVVIDFAKDCKPPLPITCDDGR